MPKDVTIGIPLFKACDYIEATLLSALSQTYDSIEFLIIDDCGDDGSIDIVERLQREHPRGNCIRILHNERNMGVGPSRNRIIDEAEGRYLYFLDSDDLIEPNTIELLIDCILEYHTDVVYASYERINNLKQSTPEQYVYPKTVFLHPEALAIHAFTHYNSFQISVCNCLYDVMFLREVKVRFIDTLFWEDMAFTYELVTHVRRAVLLPDITYHYMCRSHSLSNYQARDEIKKEEILNNISTIDYLKWKCHRMRNKSYAPYMSYNLELTSFYNICHILKNAHHITPSFSNQELRLCMRPPLRFSTILGFRQKRASNIALSLLAHLPTPLFMPVVKMLGKRKKIL